MFYDEGIAWEDAERLAKSQHGQWKSNDEWRTAIVRWLDAPELDGRTPRMREYLTLLDVAEGALHLPARTLKPNDQRRIGKILREEAYEAEFRRIGEKPMRVWLPPDYC